MASKEANRLKYQYNKKYVEAYWERKAQQQNGETATKKTRKTVRQTTISCFDDDLQPEMADVEITVCRNGKSDERYIKALELANKRLWILGIWGFLSFIVLAGEEDPRDPMPFGEFFLIKAVAMASLLICFYVGKRLHRAGYLPEELDEDDDI